MSFSGRGRYYRRKRVVTIEQTKQIDIRYMKRQGLLKPGTSGSLLWSIEDNSLGGVNYLVRQEICFDFTPCNYGGYRTWLRCPGCSRRVVQLCGYGELFLCRHCYRLPYRSSNETKRGRQLLKKHQLGETVFQSYVSGRGWGKKHWLHWKTSYRLKREYERLEEVINQ